MKEELQGEGTYDYRCRKRGCWHCEAMGLLPEPNIYAYEVVKKRPKRFISRVKRLTVKHWSDHELSLLLSGLGAKELVPLLRKRTYMSICVKISILRKRGVI